MLIHEVALVVLSYAVLAATIYFVRRVATNPKRRYDLQRDAYLARRGSQIAVGFVQLASAGIAVTLGVAANQDGYVFGWALFALAGVPLVYFGLRIYVAKLPFTYPLDL